MQVEEILRRRQAEFGHLAAKLGDTIDKYGTSWSDDMFGPFFCGMSYKLVLNQYLMELYGPTSTTKSITIAQRFGTADGIVIQLNNDALVPGRAISTSWISDYGSEDEYLFGFALNCCHLIVESAIIQETSFNFKNFFNALYPLAAILTNPHCEK